MSQIQAYFGLGLAVLIIALASYIWVLHEQKEDLALKIKVVQQQRDEAKALTTQLYRSIDSLSVERAAADLRDRRSQAGRETVISMPEGDDGPLAKTLIHGLQAADQIGGYQ